AFSRARACGAVVLRGRCGQLRLLSGRSNASRNGWRRFRRAYRYTLRRACSAASAVTGTARAPPVGFATSGVTTPGPPAFGVRRRLALQAEVARGRYEAPAEVVLPETINDDASGQRIVVARHPVRQREPTTGAGRQRLDLCRHRLAAAQDRREPGLHFRPAVR